ncbi:hypothetical protein [Deinococcus humi]|uniref:Uncharacterized protein n=1 Tax=Deinococcus humi TaxID=662880 RepID=A0A7W8K382_9DEIO|nr:hypothetical protein [Deinococcus humi]MBB5366474.1 hypothetical protein [Deinococcus humi]
MKKPYKYKVTASGKTQDLKGLLPSVKILLLALKIAEHEQPEGVERGELQESTKIAKNSFDRGWSYLIQHKHVERQPQIKAAKNTPS